MDVLETADVVTESAIFSALGAPPAAASTLARSRFDGGSSSLHASSSSSSSSSSLVLPPVGNAGSNSGPFADPPQSLITSPRQIGSFAWLPSKTPRSLMASFTVTTEECNVVWKFLCDWVQTQIAMEVPATIPRFGTIALKAQAMNIRIPYFGRALPSSYPTLMRVGLFCSLTCDCTEWCIGRVEPDQTFLDAFALQCAKTTTPPPLLPRTDSSSNVRSSTQAPKPSDVFAFNYLEMASCCGSAMDAGKAQEWLQAVIQKLGQAMHRCKRVELNMGIGVVCCANRVIEQHMVPRSTGAKPTLEYEIRTGESVVKRNLLRTSAKPSAPKTKGSFLTSGDFSQAIQVNPANESANSMPSFAFELTHSPRRPPNECNSRQPNRSRPSPLPHVAAAKASPRSQQLRSRCQRPHLPSTSTSAQPSTNPVADTEVPMEHLKLGALSADFPVLFDSLSRTLCVEPDQNIAFLVPSNRIASNFTPTAAHLVMQKVPVVSGSTSKSSGAGIMFYEDARWRGSSAVGASDYNGDLPRTVEPGAPWHGVSPASPGGRKQKMVAIEYPLLPRNTLTGPAGATGVHSGDALSCERTHDARSEERYFAYIGGDDQLLEHRWLAPISPLLIDRIVSSAVKYLIEAPDGHMKRVLNAAQQEFIANYYISAKKAILDYVLLRQQACERLRIPHGIPVHATLPIRWKWGNSAGVNGCLPDLKMLSRKKKSSRLKGRMGLQASGGGESTPDSEPRDRMPDSKTRRRQRIKAKLSALFVLSDVQIRTLQATWYDFESSILLVKLPSLETLSSAAVPLDLHSFETEQLQHAAKMKRFLMENWYGRAKSMVEDTIKTQTFSIHASAAAIELRIRHLFDAIRTLMSLQLRSLIVKSVKAYVAFFELFGRERYGTSVGADDEQKDGYSPFSGLLISLAMQNGEIQFRNPLVDIPSHLLSVLHNLLQLFHNVGRIETHFSEPLQLSTPGTPFLWNVSSQEEEIVLATIRIREIVEQNLCLLRQLQADYEVFARMHRYACSMDTQQLEDQRGVAAYRSEMEKVKATALRITAETHDKQYLRLFCVDCSHVNAALLSGFARWIHRLLHDSQEHTARLNADLRHEYKDVAARLAKKPMDLYELVDAERFVESLKTSKLTELQEKASVIKERIQFLLFEREAVYIDNPDEASSRAGDNVESSLFLSSKAGIGLFRLAPDLLASTAKTIKWRSHISKLLHDAEASLVDERARIETIFLAKRTRFQSEIEEFDGEVKGFAKKGDLRHAATYVVQLAKMKDTLFSFRKTMEAIVEEETKLQWKTTDFSKLDDIAEEMEPYEQLWKTAREFREMSSRWLRGNIFELEAGAGMQSLHQMLSTIASASKILNLNSAGAAITAEMVKKQITDFCENARLVGAILNPSMKDRHLKDISALVALHLDPHEPLTLLKVLENGAFDHLDKILEISQNATHEKQVDDALAEIDAEWKDVRFVFKPAKKHNADKDPSPSSRPHPHDVRVATTEVRNQETPFDPSSPVASTLLLRACVDELNQLVDEHQVKLQSLLCMRHAIPFSQEISSWLHFTQNIRDVVEALVEVERLWKTLSPLFCASVIDASSKETKLFATADQLYKGIVMRIQRQPLCRVVIPRAIQKSDSTSTSVAQSMLADLKTCFELLEEAKENLRIGLDGKRSSFPRFCFLSDSELVGALSWRSASGEVVVDSSVLWRRLSPCFPGIHRVQVNASKEITALVSSTGEQLSLGAPIATANASVNTWLGKIESSMITILQACIRAAAGDSERKEFRKWCLLWPEQILFVTIQHMWTLQCEQANQKQDPCEVRAAWEAIVESLHSKHSSVAKEMKAAASPHARVCLSNVLLLLSHLRDVSTHVYGEILRAASEHSKQVDTEHSTSEGRGGFESLTWLSQPRYYYEESALVVKLLAASSLAYGFEYFGSKSPSFHLTPLTLRCFQAIAQTASILSKGTCLEGGAGVGKTAVCHALSQSCGRLFVLFECANTTSFELMLQFIKGAASCGAWLAMESFHLLDPARVSIVGHLCAHVMDSLAAKNSHCTLIGSKVRLKRGGHFITVLPRSTHPRAGRTFSSEARFFFKRIVLHAPDIEIVTEFLLQQGRFVNTAPLAKLTFAVLSAFERGFALLHGDIEHRVESMQSGFLNLRFVKRVVRRATELNAKEQQASRIVEEDSTDPFARHASVNGAKNAPGEALDSHDVEKMEHKVVCIALREELNAMTPAVNLDLIEFLLRDFAANSLTRELCTTNSVQLTPRIPSLGLTPAQQEQNGVELGDVIDDIVRTNESAWVAFGLRFSQKVGQLLQHMSAKRAVVISGDIQSGKTALYKALARSVSHLYLEQKEGRMLDTLRRSSRALAEFRSCELIAMTRCVVLAPRSLTLENLLGTAAEHFGDTLLAQVIREAKRFREGGSPVNTWLVVDGDLDSSWSEKLLYLVEEAHDAFPGRQKGMALSSGKCVLLPRCMRLVMETTTLSSVSPSFLTRVGVVSLGKTATHEWRGLYRAWKQLHVLEFGVLADEIWGVLDVLLEETADACLRFVETSFQRGFPQLRLARFKSLLALFHSSIRQSWAKVSSMVSGKQRKTALHCFFLQAVVWGIGSTCDTHERQTFHEFLRHLILHGPHSAQSSLKRVLILFFPSGTSDTGGAQSGHSAQVDASLLGYGGSRAQSAAATKGTIYSFAFSIAYGMKWMRWTEYYELWLQEQASISTPSSSGGRGASDSDEAATASLTELVVPNDAMAAAIGITNQLMLANYPTLLKGLCDSGKTICGTTWLALNAAFSKAQATAATSLQATFPSGGDADAPSSQHVYVGSSTSSGDMLEQIAVFLERSSRKKKASEKQPQFEPNISDEARHHAIYSDGACADAERKMSFVFVDDLHCLEPDRKMDSALELLRVLIEHREVVHPSSKLVTPCQNILPLASIQANFAFNASQHQDMVRLTNRFIPVTLPSLTDAELSSICFAIASSSDSVLALASPSSAHVNLGSSQEVHQLLSAIVKCSIKLFRMMTGEFALDAAKAAFDPSKLHYVFRIRDIFDIVRSVCCDGKPTLTLAEKPQLARLWCHESARTLGDRLVEPREITIFHQHVRDIALNGFGLAPDVFFPPRAESASGKDADSSHLWLEKHLHFTFVGGSSGGGYREVAEMEKIELAVERSMMAMHRASVGAECLEVVVCGYVIQHVLRLTRLLRSEGRNILLLGSRGKKMATIARLAAFICRKASSLYSVSSASTQDSDLAAWKRALKDAILKSVRNQDEQIVFIFKDSWLSSPGYYDAIERFVSGAKLSSDTLAYEDLDDHVLSILRSQAHQEQQENRNSKRAMQNVLTSKASVLEYFYAQVRKKFQMVVIMSQRVLDQQASPSSWSGDRFGSHKRTGLARILWKAPRILKHCAINCFGEWPEESLVAIAQKCFAASREVEKERAVQLSQVAVQMYQSTRRCYDWYSGGQVSSGEEEEEDDSANKSSRDLDSEKGGKVETPRLARYDEPPPLQLDPSMLIDQIGLFLAFSGKLSREIDASKVKYHMGLAFLDETERILVAEQAQTELLQPEMQKRVELTRRMSGTLEKEKMTSDKLNRALELATSLVEAQRDRLAHVEAEYHELVKDSLVVFKQMQSNISVFQIAKAEESEVDEVQVVPESALPAQPSDAAAADRSTATESCGADDSFEQHGLSSADRQVDSSPQGEITIDASLGEGEMQEWALKQRRRALIKSFASFTQVPTALRQLAECLGLIFGIQPVEARDELDPDEIVMDYWESMTVRMRTKEFWEELVAFDVEARVDDKILARVLPICTSPDFEREMFASIHELAGFLCEWVQAWSSLARATILAGPKFAQLMQEREAFKNAQAEVTARKLESQTQRDATSEANALRHVSELERQEIEERLHENMSTLQMASSVWKVLASSRKKWRERYEYYTEFAAGWMGDLMLATSLMSYASCASGRFRAHLRVHWSKELRKHYLIHSAHRALQQVFQIDNVQLARWHLDGIPRTDPCAVENAVIVATSYRFPLLIDPYGMATEWVKRYEAASSKLQVMRSHASSDESLWREIESAAKRQKTLMLTDFCEASAIALRSLIGAKRRALFEVVNRDTSSISTSAGNSSNSAMPRAGRGSEANNYPCRFQLPPSQTRNVSSLGNPTQQMQQGSSSGMSTTEFGSESWRVYFVYSRTNSIPEWMLPYASQLSIVRFDFSAPYVESRCLSKVVEAYGEQHLLTEIRTLQIDIMACQEQMDAMEDEILDFFGAEQPHQVYSDVSRALRVIGNRSAMHTLESSKTESDSKILGNLTHLDRFSGIVHRSVDLAWTWRDITCMTKQAQPQRYRSEPDWFALPWVWEVLATSLQQYEPGNSFEEMVFIYTESVRKYVSAGLENDEDQLLFDFLLALRLQNRRLRTPSAPVDSEVVERETMETPSDLATCEIHKDSEVLYRTMLVHQCGDDNQMKQLCAAVPAKLVALRPDAIGPQKWRALCFLADASAELRDFMLHQADQKGRTTCGRNDAWKELAGCHGSKAPYPPLLRLSEIVRLCVISVTHEDLLLPEMEQFAAMQLMDTAKLPVPEAIDSAPPDPARSAEIRDDSDANPVLMTHGNWHSVASPPVNTSRNALHDLWHSFSSSRTPIVVRCSPGIDFLRRVTEVALMAKMTMDPSFHDTLVSDDDAFERNLLAAMQKGHWVVVPNLHSMSARLALLQKLYRTLDDRDLHSDFRLWVSSLVEHSQGELVQPHTDGIYIDAFAIHKQQRGSFALKRSLLHTFAVMKDSGVCRALEGNYEQLLKRLGVLHTVLTSHDHFGFAQWKSRFAFGDGELRAMISTLSKLDPQPQVAVDLDKLERIVRAAATSVYGSSMSSAHDRLLLGHCLDLVFPLRSSDRDASDANTSIAHAAQHAIPEVVAMIQKLETLPWKRIVEQIPDLWTSDERGPDVSSLVDTENKGWDPLLLRSQRRQRVVGKLLHLLGNGGDLDALSATTRFAAAALSQPLSVESPMASVLQFAAQLESLTSVNSEREFAEKVPQEYKKPFQQLIRHELIRLDGVRIAIVEEVRRLQAIHVGVQQLDEATWHQFCDLRRGCAPRSWMNLLVPQRETHCCDDCLLSHFQSILVERFKLFTSWVDTNELPAKIPIDKFCSSQCVLATIHQHFIRNHVGNTLCDPHCLRVVSIFEDDRAQTPVATKGDSVFVHGLRLMGHLQLDVVPPAKTPASVGAARKKSSAVGAASEIRPEGVAVVLEVTSACMATSSTASSACSSSPSPTSAMRASTRASSMQLPAMMGNKPRVVSEYLCPIYRSDAAPGRATHPETSLCVMTTLSSAQLCFSGSSLHINTWKPNE